MQVAEEKERQFREVLEFCPAALAIVDEDGRLLFSITHACGNSSGTRKRRSIALTPVRFGTTSSSDLGSLKRLRDRGGQPAERGGGLEDQTGPASSLTHLVCAGGLPPAGISASSVVSVFLWVYDVTELTQREAQVTEQQRQLREILEYCPRRAARR